MQTWMTEQGRHMTPCTIFVLTIPLLLWVGGGASAAPPREQDSKLLSIEQLMEIDVTLGTRQPGPLRTTPARSA
jgi:hypothetical protein